MYPLPDIAAGGQSSRRLFVYSGGLLRRGRVRRILQLSGYDIRVGLPRQGDLVGVWGQSPLAHRGEGIAARRKTPLVRVEDAFLRSVLPGREGEPPLGLLIDHSGVHFDASTPSDLEHLLATEPLDDSALLSRARDGMARLRASDLSKYSCHDSTLPPPDPGYVLVIDQLRDDASVKASGATAATFREMLVFAQEEHPGARVIIKSHAETIRGLRPGYYGPEHETERVSLLTKPVSPWALFEGAVGVYTVSSHMGFEAILAGHKPRVFGQPFYAGWGLTQDERPVPRRRRTLTRAQLFAAAMILAPRWYDPCRDRLCSFEEMLDQLEAQTRAFREDRTGHVAVGMRRWKRRFLQSFFGSRAPVRFADDMAAGAARARDGGRSLLVWSSRANESELPGDLPVLRVEDGFLRSRGLGADLVTPLSLVTDDTGIYYDPTRESRLERLIAAPLRPDQELRAERLVTTLVRNRLSKYNLGGALPDLPEGRRILVPGQVEDDASIRLGAGDVAGNLALLQRVRADNSDARIIYKPHPDVEAGLRPGALIEAEALSLADCVTSHGDPIALIEAVDEVWTITSLLGFEALLRGKTVVCLGAPFYAGWGLTRDLAPVPARRQARPGLHGLVHAALIGYPRYYDPVSHLPCPPEVVAERLARAELPARGSLNRAMSKVQGMLAGYARFWR